MYMYNVYVLYIHVHVHVYTSYIYMYMYTCVYRTYTIVVLFRNSPRRRYRRQRKTRKDYAKTTQRLRKDYAKTTQRLPTDVLSMLILQVSPERSRVAITLVAAGDAAFKRLFRAMSHHVTVQVVLEKRRAFK